MTLIEKLVLVLVLVFPLGQLIRLPLGFPGVGVYVHDLILGIIWSLLLIRHSRKLVVLLKKDRLSRLIIMFASWSLLTWLVNCHRWGPRSLIGLGYLIRWLLFTAPYFALKISNDQMLNDKMIKLVRFSLFLTAILGLIQYLVFPDLRHLKYFGWDDHYYRLTGTFLDPNFMGLILVLAIGLELISHPFPSFSILFYLFLLYLTYSRASWLALLALLIGWGIKKRAWRLIFFLVISYLSLVILFPRPFGEGGNLLRTFSLKSRYRSWQTAWLVAKRNPVFGVGFNNYRWVQKELDVLGEDWAEGHAGAGADNSFLFIGATTGIVGLIIFLKLVFSWRPSWLVLSVIVHSFFNNSLFYSWALILIWLLQANPIAE